MIEIAMNGPGKNSLGTEMMSFLLGQLRAAAGAPLLLTGSGDAFSAGLNLKEVAGLDEAGMATFLERLERVMCALYFYPGPTVALINGHAIAGGCVLALCCDWRVCTDDSKLKMGLNEVALGLRFPPRTLALVRARIPRQHQQQVLLGAGLFNPQDSLRLGLLDAVSANAAEVARTELARLAKLPAQAYADTKRDLRGIDADLCPEDAWKRSLREMLPIWASPEVKQRVLAALAPAPKPATFQAP